MGSVVAPAAVGAATATNTVHEIIPGWAEGTPATVPYGDVVTAEFKVNTNDASDPPLNNDATNVVVTLTASGGVFDSLPAICETADVTPPSSISPDRITLVCNLGTVVEGNATVVRAPVRATATDGSPIQVTGTVDSDTSPAGPVPPEANTPIPITYTNAMDLQLVDNPGRNYQGGYYSDDNGAQRRRVQMSWSLALLDGSTPGPASYTFPVDVTYTGPDFTALRIEGCVPVSTANPSEGHPFSDPAIVDRTNFPTCSVAPHPSIANRFVVTLSGLDYSFTNTAERDSMGQPLPNDRTYIASGTLQFSVPDAVDTASYAFSAAAAPAFTFAAGAPASYPDNTGNNASQTVITGPGTVSNVWAGSLGRGRTSWDLNYWVNQGAGDPGLLPIYHQANVAMWADYSGPGGQIAGSCTMHNTTNFVSEAADFGAWFGLGGYGTTPLTSVRFFYTTAIADTRTETCGGAWTEIPVPADFLAGNPDTTGDTLALPPGAMGVKITWDPTIDVAPLMFLRLFGDISTATPVGSEMWTSSAFTFPPAGGVWQNYSNNLPVAGVISPTPWSPYTGPAGGTNGYRDILRVQGYSGVITKEAQSGSALPGEPVTYNMTAEAQTGTLDPPPVTITVTDELPVGMEYIPGTGSPEPSSVTGTYLTGQTVTWTLPGSAANTEYPITYQAQINPSYSAPPGTVLTNVATIDVPGDLRPLASRQARDSITVPSNADTQFLKTAADPSLSFWGASSSWNMTITSTDVEQAAYTDTIDILPQPGDIYGTDISGIYTVTGVVAPPGSTVYYTTDTSGVSADPRDDTNGAPGTIVGAETNWSPTPVPNPTAIRIIGPPLAPGGVQNIAINFTTPAGTSCLPPVEGENRPGEVMVNVAGSIAENTTLPMFSSATTVIRGCVDFDKEFTSLVRQADGTYDVSYRLTATGVGEVPNYELIDTLHYGEAITINGEPTATFVPQSPEQTPVPVVNDWDADTTTLTVAEDVAIADGEVQVFDVTLNVSVDGETITWANSNCLAEEGEDGNTGLRNVATLTNPDQELTDEACEVVPFVEHEKTISSGPTPIGDGLYEVEYTVLVRNLGAGPDTYDLVDDFLFGQAVTIEGTPTVENIEPGTIDTLGTWDAEATTLAVVDDESILSSSADGPTVHEYVVTVQVSVDAPAVTLANSDCAIADETGSGLFNETTLTVDEHITNDDACAEISEPVHDKVVSDGPTPIGDSRYEVVYTVTMTNRGAADSIYDLDDRLRFGAAISVVTATVANTEPGTIAVNTGWDGTGDVRVASAVPIVAATDAGPETHVYTITVVVELPDDVAPSVVDCELGDDDGTGLLNDAVLTVNGEETTDQVCPPLPITTFNKELVSVAPNRDGTHTVTYTLTVTRTGTGSPYTLNDRLRYGPAASVRSARVAATAPATLPVNPGWNGTGDTSVASQVEIADGATHVYTATMVVDIDTAASTASNRDCALGGDENGTGLYNEATLETNGVEYHDNACEPYDPPPAARLARTGASTSWHVGAGALLMGVGGVLVLEGQRRRRRDVTGAAS